MLEVQLEDHLAVGGEIVKVGFQDVWLVSACFWCGCRSLGSLALFASSKLGERLLGLSLSGAQKNILMVLVLVLAGPKVGLRQALLLANPG